jgi:hypothetical protein
MKAKLVKKADGWYNLYDGEIGIGSTHPELQGYKLSKQNCDEIFGVTDVEKLAEDFAKNNSIYPTAQDDTEYGFKHGFNKAMELNKDKVFTLEDMRTMMVIGAACEREKGDFTFEFEAYTNHLQQPTEIEVEIEMEEKQVYITKGRATQFSLVMATNALEEVWSPKPKLDSNGCLILKKL